MKTDQTGRTRHFVGFVMMLAVFKKATLAHTFKIYINLHVLSVLIPAASPSVCSLQPACEYKVWAESCTR